MSLPVLQAMMILVSCLLSPNESFFERKEIIWGKAMRRFLLASLWLPMGKVRELFDASSPVSVMGDEGSVMINEFFSAGMEVKELSGTTNMEVVGAILSNFAFIVLSEFVDAASRRAMVSGSSSSGVDRSSSL